MFVCCWRCFTIAQYRMLVFYFVSHFFFVLTVRQLILPDAYYPQHFCIELFIYCFRKNQHVMWCRFPHIHTFSTPAPYPSAIWESSPQKRPIHRRSRKNRVVHCSIHWFIALRATKRETFLSFRSTRTLFNFHPPKRSYTLLRRVRWNGCPSQEFYATLSVEIAIGNSSKLKVCLARWMRSYLLAYCPNSFTERRSAESENIFFFVYIFIRIILHSSFDGNRFMEYGSSRIRGKYIELIEFHNEGIRALKCETLAFVFRTTRVEYVRCCMCSGTSTSILSTSSSSIGRKEKNWFTKKKTISSCNRVEALEEIISCALHTANNRRKQLQ